MMHDEPREDRREGPSRRLPSWLRSPGVPILLVSLAIFDVFAVARAFPVNTRLPENESHLRGDYDRRVDRIYRMATERASRPFMRVRERFIFHEHNPGLFMFVAESFVRLGAEGPVPNQVLSILLWNVGLIFFFLWSRAMSGSDIFAGTATAFLVTTPYLLFHSSSIHHDPYSFFFFNATLLCFTRYLTTWRRRWLLLSLLSYFFACQFYWMFYVAIFLMIIGLQHRTGRIKIGICALFTIPPILGAISVVAQAAWIRGGLAAGAHHVADLAAARSGDWRIEGSTWYPNDSWLHPEDLRHYAEVLMERIRDMMGVSLPALGAALAGTLAISRRKAWLHHGWMLWVVLAGLSWNVIMLQHTVIHGFAGMYGWFCWALIVGAFARELYGAFRPAVAPRAFAAIAVPVGLWLLLDPYSTDLARYLANIFG